MNARLDAVQATVLRAKLRRLDAWNAARRAAADRYGELLADVDGRAHARRSRPGNDDVWHLYVIRVDERDRVMAELSAAGIGVGIHYPTPVHLTEAYARPRLPRGAVPGRRGGGRPHPLAADVPAPDGGAAGCREARDKGTGRR